MREGEGVDHGIVRVRFNRVASENVFQALHPETGASLHVKRVIAVDLNYKGFPSPKHGVDECLSVHNAIG